MIVLINPRKLTEGDWLYEKVKVGRKIVRPNWEGLSQEELILLRRYKRKIKVKQGIPFVPAFFFAFILLLFKDNIFNLLFIFT
jgi:prepilin signal peptidase PulO-like enzyme (type II secretory pathway)